MTKTVFAKGTDLNVKNITIRERGQSCRLALWRNHSSSNINVGDFLEVTNVLTNEFLEEKYLSSTRHSEVKVRLHNFLFFLNHSEYIIQDSYIYNLLFNLHLSCCFVVLY